MAFWLEIPAVFECAPVVAPRPKPPSAFISNGSATTEKPIQMKWQVRKKLAEIAFITFLHSISKSNYITKIYYVARKLAPHIIWRVDNLCAFAYVRWQAASISNGSVSTAIGNAHGIWCESQCDDETSSSLPSTMAMATHIAR